MYRKLYAQLLVLMTVSVCLSGPGDFTAVQQLGIEGTMPALAIADDGSAHLTYVRGNKLYYRKSTPSLAFGQEELVITGVNEDALFEPVIALDKNGDPHVAVSDGHTYNPNTFYSQRIGGQWVEQIVAWNAGEMKTGRSTMPSIMVDAELSAYIGLFTFGNSQGGLQGGIVKIENNGGAPAIAATAKIKAWAAQIMLTDDKLWVGGRVDQQFRTQQFDKSSLDAIGSVVDVSRMRIGEYNLGVVDHTGELHMAGANLGDSPENAGWYATLSMAQQGTAPLRFRTVKHNPCGAVLPVADRAAGGRVYLFSWSDGSSTTNESGGCTPVRFARFENGVLQENNAPLDENPNKRFGQPHRATPCAAALPDGGVMLVHDVWCSGELYYQMVGADVAVSVTPANGPIHSSPSNRNQSEAANGRYLIDGRCLTDNRYPSEKSHSVGAVVVERTTSGEARVHLDK